MTVVQMPVRARWAWDARGDSRAVRVSAHPDEHVINLSVWRDDICVGTVRLRPAEAATLIGGLTEGVARLAEQPADAGPRVGDLEERLARLEARFAEPAWRTAATHAVRSVRVAFSARRAGPRSGS
jgi:hypothetical protein